jgi:hypothetical protein
MHFQPRGDYNIVYVLPYQEGLTHLVSPEHHCSAMHGLLLSEGLTLPGLVAIEIVLWISYTVSPWSYEPNNPTYHENDRSDLSRISLLAGATHPRPWVGQAFEVAAPIGDLPETS